MARTTQTKGAQRFLGDDDHMIVHDLQQAKGACEIEEILDGSRGVRFEPDTLAQAEKELFRPCHRCAARY